ncbi:MAG: YceI family protein [Spirochaetia bacterium]
MKKKILYAALALAGLIILAAVGFRVYTGMLAGSGEATREVQAERIDPEEREIGSVQYGVVSGDSDESQARFFIEEVIFGEDNLVVGTTDQLDGSIVLSFEQGTVDIGQFEINMRTIRTRSEDVDFEDSDLSDAERDEVIRAHILESGRDEYEFSTFNPTSVSGTPESFEPGDVLDLVVTGDLTVRDVTSSVDFDMEIVIESEERITGTATTTILWDDFDISVPHIGGESKVASVGDEVDLELDFVAVAE